jgi:hypothetical protein
MCEKIDFGNFSGDPKCILMPQTWLIRLLEKKFLNADSGETANPHFFTRSCPHFPGRPAIAAGKGLPTCLAA